MPPNKKKTPKKAPCVTTSPILAGLLPPMGSVIRESVRKTMSILPSTPIVMGRSLYNERLNRRKRRDPKPSPVASTGGTLIGGVAVPYGARVRVAWGEEVLYGLLVWHKDASYIADSPIPPLPPGKVRVFFDDGSWGDVTQLNVSVAGRIVKRRVSL